MKDSEKLTKAINKMLPILSELRDIGLSTDNVAIQDITATFIALHMAICSGNVKVLKKFCDILVSDESLDMLKELDKDITFHHHPERRNI
jgi:hypothetical protein